MKREMAIQYYQSVCGEMVLVDSGGNFRYATGARIVVWGSIYGA